MTKIEPPLQHLGVIMDGNRRWAKSYGLKTIEGHQAGYRALMDLLPAVQKLHIPYITFYAFSTENWSRDKLEVKGIMKLLLWVINTKLNDFVGENIRIRLVGSPDNLPAEVLKALRSSEEATAHCTGIMLGICFNYGGQQEIVDAVKLLVAKGVEAQDMTVDMLEQCLYAADMPPLDLVIRTSGERRLSGFMLWRAAYAELYFTDVLWPDFDAEQLHIALTDYAQRGRRFGI